MGVTYSAAESKALIQAMTNNIQIANEITDRLSSGCDHLIASLDSGELQGAAYTAGKGLFTAIIIPSIKKLQVAIDAIQVELTTYQRADAQIARYGTLDRDHLTELKRLRERQLQVIQAQIDENESFMKQVSSLLTGDYGTLWSDTSTLYHAKNQLEIGIREVTTKLESLEWFLTQTSDCFRGSLVVLQLAIQGATQLSQVFMSSDGSYSTAGLDMSWVTSLKNQEISPVNASKYTQNHYHNILTQTIKTIKSSSERPLQKSERLVAAYEDYLYFLNKTAFDDYWKVRSNYDGEWDLKNNKYAKEIEEDLGKKLQSSGINFRLIVNKMGDDILSVNVNAPYLSQVAGIAQVFSDKDFDKWLNSIKKGNYGDNEGDTQMIQAGIDGYVKRKKSK
ncbi:LXG domain-containing protein [Streptococcus equi]|uniref:LXG domain-containing protein n=1 Tax=Streptococcus equi TaxID=1336 RepID=UPI001E4DF903|nr:LXG domain-containing protein [Streptococcus equi]MCD3372514.1 LXG domain-containing protein [Streptococcus equi subsp. zooepidemicus]